MSKSTVKIIKTIWNTVTWVIVALVVVFAILLVGVRLFGFHVYTVLSGSMEPVYHVGSLVYVDFYDNDDAKQKSLQVGDPVTYMAGEKTVVTHRITQVVPDTENPDIIRYATKGDNNAVGDQSLLHYENVIGKPVFSIPYLGYIADYVQTPPGLYVAIALGVVVILLAFLPDILFPDEENKADTKEDKKEEDADPEVA